MAYDQDTGINARLRYSIILGNEGGFFEMNAQTGEIFLIREIDLEKLANPTLSLQIQASQVDNPFRQALARVDILVQDINDNSPEVSLALAIEGDMEVSRPLHHQSLALRAAPIEWRTTNAGQGADEGKLISVGI